MSDLLKEAIADAKAVRETALQNAKMALEEAFTPHLKSMLSAKLAEDDMEDEDEDAVVDIDIDADDEEEVEAEEGAFDNPEWLSFEVENVDDDDKRLLNYFSWVGFVFVPFSIVSLGMVLDIEKNRPHLDVSKNRLLNIISITFFIVWFMFLNLFSLSDFGVSL